MKATEISFGIEIETHVPVNATPVGPYHNGVQCPWLPAGWKTERDGSIRTPDSTRQACEFVSPVLKGADGIRQVIDAVKAMKEHGAAVNESCGIHITVSFPVGDAPALERLIHLIANFEKAIYASTGTKKRERGHYTKGLQAHGDATRATNAASHDRYHLLNLTHYRQGKSRIEIRAFAGSLNTVKIVGYIRMVLGMVERALEAKRTTKFIAKPTAETSPIARGGEGQTALNRLFYQLGWTKGRTKTTYGDVSGEQIPTHEQCKQTLMEMAKKYDQQN